jgi:small-conductance mechanosensitive channel
MPPVRSLSGELGLLLGRALALGEASSLALARVLTILLVLLLGALAYRLLTGFVRHLTERLDDGRANAAAVQRARTLGPLLVNVARWVVGFVVGMLVLQELGVDVRTLAVSAGVLGLAAGLGAQSLIRDVITGFFLLFENLIAVGDVVEVGAHTGVVEAVGLRVTKIRKFSGELRIVPNGDLTTFGHHTADWGRAIVEAAIRPDADVGAALRTLHDVGRAWREAHPVHVLEAPTAEGILRLGPSEVVLRLHARVGALHKFPLELDLRRRVKEAFAATGLRPPLTQMIVHLDPERLAARPDFEQKEPPA